MVSVPAEAPALARISHPVLLTVPPVIKPTPVPPVTLVPVPPNMNLCWVNVPED